MMQYKALLAKILHYGVDKSDRTGTGTRSLFGHQMRFDLTEGFPLVTTKQLHLRSIVHELLWMISGSTNIDYLNRRNVTIWDEWADKNGDLGPVYGKQWRSWTRYKRGAEGFYRDPIDQLRDVISEIKRNPDSRRLVVSAWNPAELDQMALSPCHCLFQFNTRPMTLEQRLKVLRSQHEVVELGDLVPGLVGMDLETGRAALTAALDRDGVPSRYLDCHLYQRSADVFLGVPFNIASYALLTSMVAQVTGMVAGDFVHSFGDVHIYHNHFDQVRLQLSREIWGAPKLRLNPAVKSLFDFKFEDIEILGYRAHDPIKAPVAV